ncbi:MAG TPA: ergothioneine biosynthesis protein EgtB, partial [Longimicrobiales bacterium]|nr:ergothioneine biosynthesis protein EgtB [Longimicrobiales bacterium]
ATRDALPLPTLPEARDYMARVRREVLDRLEAIDPGASDELLKDGFVFRMVLQHEYQHDETILQTLQLKRGRTYPAPRALIAPPAVDPDAPEPGATVRFPGGRVEHGTDDRSCAYDNERPRHAVELAPFRIDAHPVTNGAYARFVEDGGYERPDAWSGEGWAWVREAGVTAPKHWERTDDGWRTRAFDRESALDPARPVCHVCYWEAEAYASWAGRRLPTEFEWEAAASWDPVSARKLAYPWGDEAPTLLHANLDAKLFEAAPVGSYPRGVSPIGCWGMIGDVWEWTSTPFNGYPGYRTFPYPEYSEVFFGDEYRVLRGGSWATRPGTVRATFRNWDYPIRRQIFAGFRCAADD